MESTFRSYRLSEFKESKEIKNIKDLKDVKDSRPESEFAEKIIAMERVTKVVKGGRRFSFLILSVVGNKKGLVGFGFGKAKDVSEAIRKSVEKAKRKLIRVPIRNGVTIPHEIHHSFKATNILIKPATPGTGIIAGGPVRAILELAGYKDVLSKALGSRSKINVIRGTFEALKTLRTKEQIAKDRGIETKKLWD